MCVGGDGGKMERQEARVKGRMACGECRGEGVRRMQKLGDGVGMAMVGERWGRGHEHTSVTCKVSHVFPPALHSHTQKPLVGKASPSYDDRI